ncbi:hypothetical protein MAMP_00562 [Methylophaga aminisulfidivorans MP]|uniref:Uncharacterized protein n=1 Tax=Methylophaga aminisulfidivorans MP TaxID=1026882 RepID=F5T2K0_9GAMM|nr:hypothetical protein [Methylophaga aminisulfidivorans]EGL53192.1 hypothetical protein MAMP_00562 [Methylophaga aminisulfidivorans MP]
MKQGDVIYGQIEKGQWSVIKLLEIDTNDDGGPFHCLKRILAIKKAAGLLPFMQDNNIPFES